MGAACPSKGGKIAAATPAAEAQGYKVGDRVAYSILQTYSEYSAVPAAKLLPVPDNVGMDVAVACVVQGMTAHYLTTSAHADLVKPGEWMLIHGVSGGTCSETLKPSFSRSKISAMRVTSLCESQLRISSTSGPSRGF